MYIPYDKQYNAFMVKGVFLGFFYLFVFIIMCWAAMCFVVYLVFMWLIFYHVLFAVMGVNIHLIFLVYSVWYLYSSYTNV